MKKVKQILAIIGVIILVGLYVSTIVCAVSASENFMNMLMTSIYASVILNVTEIAIRCGFNDGNYFGDAFRKEFGLSPLQYRKRRKNLL